MSDLNIKSLSEELQEAINRLTADGKLESTGVVTRVGDGVASIYGLSACGFSEVLEIETDSGSPVSAFALNLKEDEIGAVLLGGEQHVRAGAKVKLTGRTL